MVASGGGHRRRCRFGVDIANGFDEVVIAAMAVLVVVMVVGVVVVVALSVVVAVVVAFTGAVVDVSVACVFAVASVAAVVVDGSGRTASVVGDAPVALSILRTSRTYYRSLDIPDLLFRVGKCNSASVHPFHAEPISAALRR